MAHPEFKDRPNEERVKQLIDDMLRDKNTDFALSYRKFVDLRRELE